MIPIPLPDSKLRLLKDDDGGIQQRAIGTVHSQSEIVEPVGVVAVGEGHLASGAGPRGCERPAAEVVTRQRRVVLRRPGRRPAVVARPLPHGLRVPVVDVQAQRLRRGRGHGGQERHPHPRRRRRHGQRPASEARKGKV